MYLTNGNTNIFTGLFDNIVSFISSLPTVVVALLTIAIILKLFGITLKGIVRAIIGSLVISLVLGAFGVTLPTFSQIFSFLSWCFNYIKALITS